MKKYLLPLTLALATSVSVSAKTKLDSQAQAYVDIYRQVQLNPSELANVPAFMPFDINPKSRTASQASVFVTLADGASAADVEAYGLTVLAQAGNMVIANGSIEDIVELGETDVAKNIAFGSKADPLTKTAREMTGVASIHAGSDGLKQAYTGDGVICGIFDTGFDALHPNFNKKDQSESRLARVWRFGSYDGSCTEYTKDNLSDYTPDSQTESHGTHTVGCLGGAYNEKSTSKNTFAEYNESTGKYTVYSNFTKGNFPYYGMAPDATLLVGAGDLYDNNTMVALTKMVDYAKAESKPLVISLSIGTTAGSHDEYDSFTSYLDNIANDAIVCIAAGNDGDSELAIVKDLTSSDKQVKTFIDASTSSTGYFDFYSNDATTFTVTPFIYNYVTNSNIYELDVTSDVLISTTSGSSALVPQAFSDAFQSGSYLRFVVDAHENTSKRYSVRVTYNLGYNSSSNSRKTKQLGFIIKGSAGQRIYMTRYGDAKFTTEDFADCDAPTNEFTISSMACGKNTIVVGAHNSVNYIPYLTGGAYYKGDQWDKGKISTFTSFGELYDGRKLPHICAPGTNIISSVNSYDTGNYSDDQKDVVGYVTLNGRKYYWSSMDGTSMATPILAGALATWCEAYPQLTGAEALKIIQETATVDDLVTSTGTGCQWGAGRFNALAGLQKILGINGVKNIVADKTDVLVSNTGNIYQAFVAGASKVTAQLYNTAGQLVANASANDEKVDLDASHLSKGIYILKVNNNYSQRIVLN